MQTNIYFNSIKNWDNKTWLSSLEYISSFNKFLISRLKLNYNSKIIDIGCGRGKILGNLSNKLKLKKKPLGVDVENHKDRDKRIDFKKIDAISFFKTSNQTFDLILIKQTIHLLKISEIKNLLNFCKNKLTNNGKIVILTLDPFHNQIPTFSIMAKHLKVSLERDKKIMKLISKLYPNSIRTNFTFNVKISKKKYTDMIKKRYISILLKLSFKQILQGIEEINIKYKKVLKFNDKLKCVIIKK